MELNHWLMDLLLSYLQFFFISVIHMRCSVVFLLSETSDSLYKFMNMFVHYDAPGILAFVIHKDWWQSMVENGLAHLCKP